MLKRQAQMPENLDFAKQILEVIPPVMREIRKEMRSLAKSDLTVPQYRILNHLSNTSSSNRDVAEWMGVTSPTMSRMINALVERSLLERAHGKKDRREVRLSLTPKGRKALEAIRAAVQQKLAEKFVNLPPEQKLQLSEGLEVLKNLFL